MQYALPAQAQQRPRIGDPAPWPAGVVDQAGMPVALEELRSRLVLVYFYPRDQTAGCVLPTYGLAHGRIPGLPILAISLEGEDAQREFLEHTGGQCSAILDEDGALRRSYGLTDEAIGHHHAFLVAGDGSIVFTWSGIDVEVLWRMMIHLGPAISQQPG